MLKKRPLTSKNLYSNKEPSLLLAWTIFNGCRKPTNTRFVQQTGKAFNWVLFLRKNLLNCLQSMPSTKRSEQNLLILPTAHGYPEMSFKFQMAAVYLHSITSLPKLERHIHLLKTETTRIFMLQVNAWPSPSITIFTYKNLPSFSAQLPKTKTKTSSQGKPMHAVSLVFLKGFSGQTLVLYLPFTKKMKAQFMTTLCSMWIKYQEPFVLLNTQWRGKLLKSLRWVSTTLKPRRQYLLAHVQAPILI